MDEIHVNAPYRPAVAPHLGGSAPDSSRGIMDRFKDIGSALSKTASKPLLMMGFNINPLSSTTKGPTEALRRIDDLANRGLQRAAIRGVRTEPVAGRLHAELDEILTQRTVPAQEAGEPSGKGPVAVIPSFPLDEEVTRAIPLQARVDATDWKAETIRHRDELCDSLSAFSAVYQMREKAGIKEQDNTKLQKIVLQATQKGETRTLWDIFTQEYSLTWGQKFWAGLIYWCCYQTSLISNTVQAYLKTFIESLTKDLANPDSNQTRLKFIRLTLDNANEFLVEDIRATKQFANAAEPGGGDLEAFRKRAIEGHYANSLEALCKAFSKRRVEEDTPYVEFFENMKKIPVFKYVFKGLEWVINRLVIQTAMKRSILPPVLKSAVENGLQATQPDNIAFSLQLTRRLTEQLERLRMKLEDTSTPSGPTPASLPGTEILPALIKNLKLVLDLEPYKTQPELRQKFVEIEGGKWILDQKIEEIIEDGIKEGCDHLFNHMIELFRSSEAFATILESAKSAFAGPNKDLATLQAEYKEEQLKLKRAAADIFQKIIHTAIQKKVGAQKPEDAKKTATEAFSDGQTVAKKVLDELKKLCEQMTQKINRSGQAPTPENNIQGDIAAFLQFMQMFATRKEIQDRINALQGVDKEAIWRLVTPIYEQAARLEEKVLALQELQDHYPSHSAVSSQFNLVRELAESVRNQFHAQPRHLRNPLIQTLERTCEDIAKSLGPKAPATLHLQRHIASISKFSESIAKEQQVLDALFALYPPRDEQAAAPQEGLLDQLLNYERGIHPRGFQPKVCLREISKLLEYFPEQKQLRDLIDTGSNISTIWPQLSVILQAIYERHKAIKDQDGIRLDAVLRDTAIWSQDKVEKYRLITGQDHIDMQKLIREISTDVAHLRTDAYRLQLDLPFYFNSRQTKIATVATGAAVGWGFSKIGATLGALVGAGPLGAAAGAGLGAVLYTGTHNLTGLLSKQTVAIAKTAGAFVAGTATSYFLPGFVPSFLSQFLPSAPAAVASAAGALTGLQAEQAIHTNAQNKVLPEVLAIFENAYQLVLSPRIYHAATTRALKTLVDVR